MKRYEEVMGIKRRISKVGTGGIQAGDPNAIERLEAKATQLEERQEVMKYRKHGTLEGFEGLDPAEAESAMKDMERFGTSKPYPSWELSNNLVENGDAMRLQLFFDGKPEGDTRSVLKKNGFRWSPKNGAWQRQLTDNARRALKAIEERQ